MVEMGSKCLFKYPGKHMNDIWTVCSCNTTAHHVRRTVVRLECFIFPRFEGMSLQPMEKFMIIIFGKETTWHSIRGLLWIICRTTTSIPDFSGHGYP